MQRQSSKHRRSSSPQMADSVRARAHWARARQAVSTGRVSTAAGALRRAARGLVKRAPRSALGRMLSSSSSSRAARLWSRTQLCAVVVSLGVHAVSTVNGALSKYSHTLFLLEIATSLLFSLDYVFRLYTCREKSRFSRLGPISAIGGAAWESDEAGRGCFLIARL